MIRGQRPRICKTFEITRIIYWKFLVSFDTLNRFFHIPAFMDYFQHFENLNSISVPSTLVCRIDVQGKINMQVEKFLKNIKKHAGENRRVGGKFSGKSINVQGRNFLANQ